MLSSIFRLVSSRVSRTASMPAGHLRRRFHCGNSYLRNSATKYKTLFSSYHVRKFSVKSTLTELESDSRNPVRAFDSTDYIVAILGEEQVTDIVTIPMIGRWGNMCDSFIIGTCNSVRHLKGAATELSKKAKERLGSSSIDNDKTSSITEYSGNEGIPVISGLDEDDPDWIVLDCGNYVVHLMTLEARLFYDLDGLWGTTRAKDLLKPKVGVDDLSPVGSIGSGDNSFDKLQNWYTNSPSTKDIDDTDSTISKN